MAFAQTETAPAVLTDRGRFLIKIAENEAEVARAQRLRYEVFRAEQGRLHSADAHSLDQDEYDEQFLHLLVLDRESGRLAGTYRMQSGAAALAGRGFYSEREYDIPQLWDIAESTFEVGRSCVAPDYRTGAVISLLWAGIAEMRRRWNFRYLIGCASLEDTSPELGWGMFEYFRNEGCFSQRLFGRALPSYRLPEPAEIVLPDRKTLQHHVPPLLKGYMRLGAKIAGEPVLDRDFGSIDFLVLFDFEEISERYARHFDV